MRSSFPMHGMKRRGICSSNERGANWEANMTDPKEVERNCPECDGTGQDRGMKPIRLGEKNEFGPCTKCGGSGKIKEAAN